MLLMIKAKLHTLPFYLRYKSHIFAIFGSLLCASLLRVRETYTIPHYYRWQDGIKYT